MFNVGESFAEILLHERRLRTYTADLSLDELAQALAKLTRVYEKRKDDATEQERIKQRKKERIQEIQALIQKEGLSIEDVFDSLPHSAALSKAQYGSTPQYACTDDHGNIVPWSGKGRRPKAMNDKLDAGASIDDFRVKPKR